MKRILGASALLLAGIVAVAMTSRPGDASDHDDGENQFKERALNLTDHYAFKSPSNPAELSLIMYVNPRSLPGRQYNLATNARYEFHVTKIGARTDAASGKNDFVFRFEAGAADATGAQPIKLTVLKDMGGTLTEVGTHDGMSTAFAASKANMVVTNTANVGNVDVKYFVGMRADSFTFDVVRFFQVRNFLAGRFFGKGGNRGAANATLPPNCEGDPLLAGPAQDPDGDFVNLWNPPSCAPDFTHNLNVTAIVLNVPIAQLGGTIFDTWSTVSVAQ